MQTLLPYIGEIDFQDEVTLQELKRLPNFRINNWMRLFTFLGGIEFLFTLPGCWIPFIHWLWRLPSVMAGSTMVTREIENRTWNTLRVTPLTVRQIIIAKYASIFRYMESNITIIIYIRAVPIIIFGATWMVSTLTVLPQQGLEYWLSRSIALVFAGAYYLLSPVLDVAVDGALGVVASTLSQRRSTAMIIALLMRLCGWLLPLAIALPLQLGEIGAFGGLMNPIPSSGHTLRALSVVSTFGPSYAFLWGLDVLPSVILVVGVFLLRLGLVRLLLKIAVFRAERLEE